MISARRLYVIAAILGTAAFGCLLVAFLRRHSIQDAFGSVVGVYFSRSSGPPEVAGGGNLLDPFQIGNAYLWLGAGCALALSSLVLLVTVRLGARQVSEPDR